MRKSGTLQTWNDDRGFGFISPLEGNTPIFVHISAFPKDGSRPTIGEKVTYEEISGRDGRAQAAKVERKAFPGPRPPKTKSGTMKNSGGWLGTLFAVAVISIAVASGYQWYKGRTHRLDLEALPARPVTQAPAATPSTRSSPAICRLSEGWLIPQRSAARRKWPASTRATK